jgi:hypothetical protein
MKPAKIKAAFENEAALCAAFIAALPEGWTAYPETAGFDIVLVRGVDGAQIGVEAKMTLNAKVLLQASEGLRSSAWEYGGPDFRAALVPAGTAGVEMKCIARYLGITVLECKSVEAGKEEAARQFERWGSIYPEDKRDAARENYVADTMSQFKAFDIELPAYGERNRWREDWVDHCPVKRLRLPDYVPDVKAGASGPSSLSDWKIKAIKICIILERRGWVAIADFKHLQINRQRWLEMKWLAPREGHRGHYVQGPYVLNLRAQHPVNYGQIEADWEKWAPKEEPATVEALL